MRRSTRRRDFISEPPSTEARRPSPPLCRLPGAALGALFLLTACDRGAKQEALPGAVEVPPAEPPRASLEVPRPSPESKGTAQSATEAPPDAPKRQDGPAPPDAAGRRLFAKSRNVWIRSEPSYRAQWIGALAWGNAVRLRSEEPKSGPGCAGPWAPVEPRGWVCVDGERATFDENDPVYQKILPYRARVESPWPHRYAVTTKDVRRFESLEHARPFLEARRGRDAALTGTLAPELPPLPKGLSERRDRIVARSAFAYADQGDAFGIGLLLAGDLSWVPRGDVTLVPPSEFQGVELVGEKRLPIAFFRRDETPAYRRLAPGEFERAPHTFPRHGHVLLDEPPESVGRTRYYRVTGSDLWVSHREAVIAEPEFLQKGPGVDRDTTVEISILGGWLVAFRKDRPVYVTMISAGRGGGPVPGRELVSTASTPVGRFEISSKLKTATMESSGGPIIHGDVPWTQNFSGPHAIHTAYWHDDFGDLKSAGCVNVSPKDGKWLFEFTEPQVPENWHAVRYLSRYGGTTRVILHE